MTHAPQTLVAALALVTSVACSTAPAPTPAATLDRAATSTAATAPTASPARPAAVPDTNATAGAATAPDTTAPPATRVEPPSGPVAGPPMDGATVNPDDVPRLDATDVHARVVAGTAQLVCAYSSEEQCARKALLDSISLTEYQRTRADIPPERQLIFYCS